MLSITALFETKAPMNVGRHNDIPDSEFIEKELKMGIEVEREHSDDPEVCKAIAKDHLSEISDYYTRLTQMEEEAEDLKDIGEFGGDDDDNDEIEDIEDAED